MCKVLDLYWLWRQASFQLLLGLFLCGHLCFHLLFADECKFEFKVAEGGVRSDRLGLGVTERHLEVFEQALDILSLEEVSVVFEVFLFKLIQITDLH